MACAAGVVAVSADGITIALLADHPSATDDLRRLFESEWSDYYGPGGPGDAAADLVAFCSRDALPVGVVALHEGRAIGVAALKAASIDGYPQFTPWAAAALVAPDWRRRGVGARLIAALEEQACRRGDAAIYTGTATAQSLMRRLGWEYLETARHRGEEVAMFRKRLDV